MHVVPAAQQLSANLTKKAILHIAAILDNELLPYPHAHVKKNIFVFITFHAPVTVKISLNLKCKIYIHSSYSASQGDSFLVMMLALSVRSR